MTNKSAEIYGHRVSWHLNGYEKYIDELPESEVEHIQEMIKEGYNMGELCSINNKGIEHWGWWSIPAWQDIALELMNALTFEICNKDKLSAKAKAAIKRFNENWI